MDLELIKQIFTDKETSKKWDEFFYDGMHKDIFKYTKEDYHEAFLNYSNKIVDDLKKESDKIKTQWLINFINIYLYDFALENPNLLYKFDLFYEVGKLNITEEEYKEVETTLDAISFEDIMTNQILNENLKLIAAEMLKYVSLFVGSDFPVTNFILNDSAMEILDYSKETQTMVFSPSFLKIIDRKPLLGYSLLLNELYRDKNTVLSENAAKERAVLNAVTCSDYEYYLENYMATTPIIHLCNESVRFMTNFLKEFSPDKLDEFKKMYQGKNAFGNLRKIKGKVHDIDVIFNLVKDKLLSVKRFEEMLQKNKNLIKYYEVDGTKKEIKIDYDFIENIVKQIFTDKEVYAKFINFKSNHAFFGENNNSGHYLHMISKYTDSLCFEKKKLTESEIKWLVNCLEHITNTFNKNKTIATVYEIFNTYDKKEFSNLESKKLVSDALERMQYKEKVLAIQKSLDPKKPNKYTSEEYNIMFMFLSSNENNIDLKVIRSFFACFLNETINITNEHILKTYIKAMAEKFLAKKGISVKCAFGDLESAKGQHIPTASGSVLVIDKMVIKGRGKEAAYALRTVFHEMRHAVQEHKIKTGEINYSVLQWTKDKVLRRKYGKNYYEENYKIYVPEIDARLAGNIYLKRFLKDVAPNLLSEEFEQELANDIAKDNNLKSTLNRKDGVNKENNYVSPLDLLLEDEVVNNPALLNDYPILRMEYREDGRRRQTGEIYKEYKTSDDEKIKASYLKVMKFRSISIEDIPSDLKSIAIIPFDDQQDLSEVIKLFRQVLKRNYIFEINRHHTNGYLDAITPKIINDLESIEAFLDSRVINEALRKKPFKHLELMYQLFLEDKKVILNTLESKQKYSQTMKK